MKKTSAIFLCLLLASVLLLSSCFVREFSEEISDNLNAPEITSPAIPEPKKQTTTSAPDSTNAPETSAADTTANSAAETTAALQPTKENTDTQPVTRPQSSVEHTTVSGYNGLSSMGYDITVLNGVTYVNGILIANKTYALPAEYNPGDLTQECKTAFYQMKDAAAAAGCNIYISSGFRSYDLQNSLYTRYCNRDGVQAADRYSARPGHSEHQTGLGIDLNTITYDFADTPEGQWVAAHCYEYGFIIRYPQNREAETGYRYEPWHIRYLGVDTATAVYQSGLCLEEYLGITSVYPY